MDIRKELYQALYGFAKGAAIGIGLVIWFRAIVPWLINMHQDTYLGIAIVGSFICIFGFLAVVIEFVSGFFNTKTKTTPLTTKTDTETKEN